MSDIALMIKISEDDYKEVKEDTYSGTPFENRVFSAIANGTPIPDNVTIAESENKQTEKRGLIMTNAEKFKEVFGINTIPLDFWDKEYKETFKPQTLKPLVALPNGGWIPVSERLPKENDYCLCCDKDGYMAIGCIKNWSIRRLDGTRYCGKDWSFDDDKIDTDVIAWMPLPEPYKVESKDEQTEKSCNNCAMQYSCVGLIYGNYWCWKPKESEE